MNTLLRHRIEVRGIVQGVGFRPFVYQTAMRFGLSGWVLNDSDGVVLEVEGEKAHLDAFASVLRDQPPPLAAVAEILVNEIPVTGEGSFIIRQSQRHGHRSTEISPDTFVCADCLTELFDPADRRFRYPFINCTNCGPRYTLVTDVPYDRGYTTMAGFTMCPACQQEYDDPSSRRFHAQPNACPDCGPQVLLRDASGQVVNTTNPVSEAVSLLSQGCILAVKGVGGYHLAVDPCHDQALRRLRRRKGRDEKPFALMAADVTTARRLAVIDEDGRRLLESTERPIVLLPQRSGHGLSPQVAPQNRYFGLMLPYTPLHYLLLRDHFDALVMTSANFSEEPIVFRDEDAMETLRGLADYTLEHNRPIHIRTDDSIVRILGGRGLLLRRSRGFVPRAIRLSCQTEPVLAVGAELKNTLCLTRGHQAYMSQHIGDLKSPEVFRSFLQTFDHFRHIFGVDPAIVAHDLHPDYQSTGFAQQLQGKMLVGVQHHHAHLASCLAENCFDGEAIGVVFDGAGYGEDGHVWGGEFLLGDCRDFRRAGHLAYLPMPGGDAATREPLRMGLSALFHAFGRELPGHQMVDDLPSAEIQFYLQMMERGLNTPLTSSCGRLFDAVAALAGLRYRVSYEGQAALELEMAIPETPCEEAYSFVLERRGEELIVNPAEVFRAVVKDRRQGVDAGHISLRFHNGLARMILDSCLSLRDQYGLQNVALSGGVFQNRYLTEKARALLQAAGFHVLLHSLVPPNDGGISLGQAVVAAQRTEAGRPGC
ncbi:carbamoyltransferase HypF [Desulfuromonas sp. AOP6]|uniref:carbamoyltransferase HypF n=1 Tax=Desulfuromonas sp. AOP6 TaxID=1566351 RepID=UPI001272D61D|nr:carbamoyltransferase HypF [Desulfuromonas sp. AOP6]BCA79430.1 carbamoyltransferase HypF [Desulfuromonas sp. AOP6]